MTRKQRHSIRELLLVFLCDEQGYIDIGMGSMIIQVLIAGFVGGLFITKSYWAKIIGRIKSLKGRKDSNNDKQNS